MSVHQQAAADSCKGLQQLLNVACGVWQRCCILNCQLQRHQCAASCLACAAQHARLHAAVAERLVLTMLLEHSLNMHACQLDNANGSSSLTALITRFFVTQLQLLNALDQK